MQIIENDGSIVAMEPWEESALEAARAAHDAETGEIRQYDMSRQEIIIHEALIASLPIPDEDAGRMVASFPEWRVGEHYQVGYRVGWEGVLYKALQEHESESGWEPANAPNLWARVLGGQDGSIGEWEQPDSTNPYMAGDKVTHNGKSWESLVDNNVWEPGAIGTESLWAEA